MSFVQVIEYQTSDLDGVRRVNDEWKTATEGKRTAKRIVLGKYRDQADRICEMVFFDSRDDAMRNSDLPETQEYARKLGDLVEGEPQFFDIDIVDDQSL